MKTFRLKLATQLIGTYKSQKRAGRPSSTATELLPPTLPCLDHLPARGDISRRCIHCQKKQQHVPSRRRSSIWVGNACPEKPHLCLKGDYYKLWHENNFSKRHSITIASFMIIYVSYSTYFYLAKLYIIDIQYLSNLPHVLS